MRQEKGEGDEGMSPRQRQTLCLHGHLITFSGTWSPSLLTMNPKTWYPVMRCRSNVPTLPLTDI